MCTTTPGSSTGFVSRALRLGCLVNNKTDSYQDVSHIVTLLLLSLCDISKVAVPGPSLVSTFESPAGHTGEGEVSLMAEQ